MANDHQPTTYDLRQASDRRTPSAVGGRLSLIDTHCHLDFESFHDDIEAVIERATAAGVTRMIVPSLDLDNAEAVLALTERFPNVYAAVGVHPNSAAEWRDEWIDRLYELAQRPKVVAIGEIGLDTYWDKTPLQTQQRALIMQLKVADELGLPQIIHNRDASAELIPILTRHAQREHMGHMVPRGVLHSFSADWNTAESALALAYHLGFTGPLTYKKADDLRAIAARVPLDSILIETDAPFLAPHPFRGKRNEPAHVRLVAERLAEVRGISVEEVAAATTENALRLFARPSGSRNKQWP
jgi:TatD DNase family protein